MKSFQLQLLFFFSFLSAVGNYDKYDSLELRASHLISYQLDNEINLLVDSVCKTGTEENDQILNFFCHYLSARLSNNSLDNCLQAYIEVLEYHKTHNLPSKYTIYPKLGISQLYYEAYDRSNNIRYLIEAEEIARHNKHPLLPKILRVLSIVMAENGDTIASLKYHTELLEKFSDDLSPTQLYFDKFIYFFYLKNLDSSLYYGNKFIDLKGENHLNIINVYIRIGELYLLNKDTSSALLHLNKAFNTSKGTSFYQITHDITTKLSDIYLIQGNTERAQYFRKITQNLEDSLVNFDTAKNLAKVESNRDWSKKTKGMRVGLIASIVLSLILAIYGIAYYFFKIRKKKNTPIGNDLKEPAFKLSEKEYLHIEQQMQHFFRDALFLRKECTMGYLVKKLKLKNDRYLRAYLTNRYKKGFNEFVNDLRIDHIVEKLKNDKYLRNYTVEEIASEAGFSSRIIFSRTFKKRMKTSPADFINNIGN